MAQISGSDNQQQTEQKAADSVTSMAMRVAEIQDSTQRSERDTEQQLAAIQDLSRTVDAGFNALGDGSVGARGAGYVQTITPEQMDSAVSSGFQRAGAAVAQQVGQATQNANAHASGAIQNAANTVGAKIDENKDVIAKNVRNVALSAAQNQLRQMNMGLGADAIGAYRSVNAIQGTTSALTAGVADSANPLQQFGQNTQNYAVGRIGSKVGNAVAQTGLAVVGEKIGSSIASKVVGSGVAKVIGGAIGSALGGPVGAAVVIGVTALGDVINSIGTGITNLNRKYAQTGRTGAESGMYALGTDFGLSMQQTFDPRLMFMSDQEKQGIQQGALNRGYQYDTSTYNSYIDTVAGAMKNYNFSQTSAERIFDYRVRQMGESTQQVNQYLDSLAKTAKDSNESMDQLDKAITDTASALKTNFGMTDKTSSTIAQSLMAGKSQEQQGYITASLSNSNVQQWMSAAQATGQDTNTYVAQRQNQMVSAYISNGSDLIELINKGADYQTIYDWLENKGKPIGGSYGTFWNSIGATDNKSAAAVLQAWEPYARQSNNGSSTGSTSVSGGTGDTTTGDASKSTAANSGDNGQTPDVAALYAGGYTANQLDSDTYTALKDAAAERYRGNQDKTTFENSNPDMDSYINEYIQEQGAGMSTPDILGSALSAGSGVETQPNATSTDSGTTNINTGNMLAPINLIVEGKVLASIIASFNADQGAADGTSTRNGNGS